MFSRIRKRLTYANVAMTLALVFAMSGGAYAAGKYLITSTKQISPKVIKSLKGKPGPAGPEGKAGTPGAAGKEGAPGKEGKAGANGTNGKEGESVVSATLKAGEGGCAEGGSKFTVGGKITTACGGERGPRGTEGSPWTAGGVLPSEATETGVWSFGPEPEKVGVVEPMVASFAVQLKEALKGEGCSEEQATRTKPCQTHLINPAGEEFVNGTPKPQTECKGNVLEPKAAAGQLCVYIAELNHGVAQIIDVNKQPGATRTGALLEVFTAATEHAEGRGSWAVTAE